MSTFEDLEFHKNSEGRWEASISLPNGYTLTFEKDKYPNDITEEDRKIIRFYNNKYQCRITSTSTGLPAFSDRENVYDCMKVEKINDLLQRAEKWIDYEKNLIVEQMVRRKKHGKA